MCTVVLDLNECVLHNEWIAGVGHAAMRARPNLKPFVNHLRSVGVHFGVWTGAFTAKRLKELLDFFLSAAGMKKKDLVLVSLFYHRASPANHMQTKKKRK